MVSTVTKRNGSIVPFDKDKIRIAILKAMEYGSGIKREKIASDIADEIENDAEEIKEEYMTFDAIEYEEEKPEVKRATWLKEFYDNGGIIICDRYVRANMIHQGAKLENVDEKCHEEDCSIDVNPFNNHHHH